MAYVDRQVQRCVWFTVRFIRNDQVTYGAYQERFNLTERTYYRDLALLDRIGVKHTSVRDGARVELLSVDL